MPEVIHFDEAKLRQMLINRVGNAIKFTDHGRIDLLISANKPSQASATVPGDAVPISITVRDTGMGISAGNKARIFDAFEQAEGQKIGDCGGTGQGLSLARQLVHWLGGG